MIAVEAERSASGAAADSHPSQGPASALVLNVAAQTHH